MNKRTLQHKILTFQYDNTLELESLLNNGWKIINMIPTKSDNYYITYYLQK